MAVQQVQLTAVNFAVVDEVPADTATATFTPTATHTATNTATSTATSTPTATNTATATASATPTALSEPLACGSSIVQVSNNNRINRSPRIDGSHLAYTEFDGSNYEVVYWDAVSGISTITTNNGYQNEPSSISGQQIVWAGTFAIAENTEIFMWDGSSIIQLTDNSFEDGEPQISGSNVVWQGYDGNDTEIFMWGWQ